MNYYGQETSEKIATIFEKFRMPTTGIDEYDKGGRDMLIHKLNQFTLNGKEIKFAMLGYPFKSTNTRDKVIGDMPDLGEELSFNNFNEFHKQVKEIYAPGAQITVVSDGLMFNEVLDIPETIVEGYYEINQDLARASGVELLNMRSFFKAGTTLGTMRNVITNNFGITTEVLSERIMFDANVNELYRGIMWFMKEEVANREFPSNKQLQRTAKAYAREAMLRNEAYSQFMAYQLSSSHADYIRLSMHPSTNNGIKYSFQLINSPKAWSSPWQCAIALDNGVYRTVHKKDVQNDYYDLIMKDGRPYFYLGNQEF